LFAALCTSTLGETIYVDDDAAGANDGTSWENAYTFLQDALADANSAEKPVEIRVAQGIYKPDMGANQTPGDREATFKLINGVTIKGGYAGVGELDPNARDIELYETILSGDLNGDDVEVNDQFGSFLNEPTRSENSYHVVTSSSTDPNAVIDGFTITAGNANGPILDLPYPENNNFQRGGGVFCIFGDPNITHCILFRNSGNLGGGMYNFNSNPILTNCMFKDNSSYYGSGMANMDNSGITMISCIFQENLSFHHGSGICNIESNSMLQSCEFIRNTAIWKGGGIYNYYGSHILTKCNFSENLAWEEGGGISNEETTLTLNNCTFFDNSSLRNGGGMISYTSSLTINNCIFSGNSSKYDGGGMINSNTDSNLNDCKFYRNSAGDGGGIHIWAGSTIMTNCIFNNNSANVGGAMNVSNISQNHLILANCSMFSNSAIQGKALACASYHSLFPSNLQIVNSIFWGDGNEISNLDNSIITITYSNIQGGCEGEGNIDEDPLFANPGYWADINDPNVIVEPNVPNAVWIDGDYHLKSEAGRWDPVIESWVVDDVTSPCIDAGDPNSAVGDEPEPNGDIINMGAYGGTVEASMSPAGAEQIVYIQWLGHSTVKVWTDDCIVYVDPERVPDSLHDATLVCVTHTHGDHYSPSDISKVSNAETQFVGPPDVIQLYGSGQTIAPGQTIEFDFITITAVPAYNINKSRHPKSNNWVGYIIELGGKRIYVAGDTDLIEEMKSLGDIDVAFLPAGGTYTMDATEAAEATGYIKPDLAIPYHWGQIVGTLADAQRFAELAQCPAMVLAVGETISSDNWPEYSPLIAHWALDETEGYIAYDSTGCIDATVHAGQWAAGKIDGALQFNGLNTYMDCGDSPRLGTQKMTLAMWLEPQHMGGMRYILARSDKESDAIDYTLMRHLEGEVEFAVAQAGSDPVSVLSMATTPLNEWTHVAVSLDGSEATIYINGRTDASAGYAERVPREGFRLLISSLNAGTQFYNGKIDDVRIYNVALTSDEIETLVH